MMKDSNVLERELEALLGLNGDELEALVMDPHYEPGSEMDCG